MKKRSRKKYNWNRFFIPILLSPLLVLGLLLYSFFSFSFFSFPLADGVQPKYTVLIISPRSFIAEMQESQHNCRAINNLGSACYIFEYYSLFGWSWHHKYMSVVQDFISSRINPDFVLYPFPDMVRDDGYVKYGVLDIARREMVDFTTENKISQKTLDWLELFDGFIFYGDKMDWSTSFIKAAQSRNPKVTSNLLFDYYPSIFETAYSTPVPKNLVYMGTNWDVDRSSEHYKDIFKLLDQTGYFKVYGFDYKWSFIKNSYAGLIDYDPDSLINVLHDSGMVLLLHSNFHKKYGIPSKRIFEAAAAGAVIISDKNPFIMREFGDCVYYIDPDLESSKVVQGIDNIVASIKSNPNLANQKAACAHKVFLRKFTLEKQWERVFAMHEKVRQNL